MGRATSVLANSDEDDDKEVSAVNTLFSKQVDDYFAVIITLTEKDLFRISSRSGHHRGPLLTVDVETSIRQVSLLVMLLT